MTDIPQEAPARQKVLLVEDEADTRRGLETVLRAHGYAVAPADLVSVGWGLFSKESPDIAVIDLNLPDGSGLDLCRKIRGHKERGSTPVIILTAKGQFDDKLAGFEAGADQYLVKPVQPEELRLWVQALLRRLSYDKSEGDALRVGGLEIDLSAHLIRWEGASIGYLTGKEFDLLYYLVKHRPKVLTRKQILANLWHTITVDHVVDTHLSNLRAKLPPPLAAKLQNVPGKGFRFLE